MDFYKTIKKFIIDTDVQGNMCFVGASLSEISILEKETQCKFPEYLSLYLQEFGKKFEFYSIRTHEYFFSLQSIKNAIQHFNNYNLQKIIEDINGRDASNLIPLLFDESRAQMILLDANSNSGEMYCLTEMYLEEGCTNCDLEDIEDIELLPHMNFIQNLQERLFLELRQTFKTGGVSSTIDLSKEEWCKFHLHYYSDRDVSYEIGVSRNDFMKRSENNQNVLFTTFSEYEVNFIKYLIQERGVPAIPEIFDPFNQ